MHRFAIALLAALLPVAGARAQEEIPPPPPPAFELPPAPAFEEPPPPPPIEPVESTAAPVPEPAPAPAAAPAPASQPSAPTPAAPPSAPVAAPAAAPSPQPQPPPTRPPLSTPAAPAAAPEPAKTCASGSPESLSTPPPATHFGFAGSTPALGELTRPPGPGATVGAGLEKIDRDLFLATTVATSFALGPVHLGIQAPLRWRVWNLDTEKAYFQLRKQDWDEVSDWFRILRYAEYGTPRETVYARVGELSGTTLGHGTIVNWYYNAVDVDHWQTGARFNVNLNPGGLETMLQSVSAPRLGGARAYVRPWYFIDRCSPLYRLALGASVFVDGAAPTTLAGSSIDAHDNLLTAHRALAIYGLDAEYPLLATEAIDLTPYADLNFIGGQGTGFHGGVLAGLHPPLVDFQARLEYRRLGARYLPAYFDALYEVQRFGFRDGKPKLQYLDDGGEGSARNGLYGELVVSIGNAFTLFAGYEDYSGRDNSGVQLRLLAPELLGLRLGAYYLKRDFDGFRAIVDRDGALGILELRYQLSPVLSVVGQAARQWKLQPTGVYQQIDTYNFGVQLGWTF